jgi:hypothetical protein
MPPLLEDNLEPINHRHLQVWHAALGSLQVRTTLLLELELESISSSLRYWSLIKFHKPVPRPMNSIANLTGDQILQPHVHAVLDEVLLNILDPPLSVMEDARRQRSGGVRLLEDLQHVLRPSHST